MSERISRAILVGLATVGLLSLIAAALGETLHLTTMLVVLVAMTLAQCLLP